MHPALKLRAKHEDAAFARRGAESYCCRQTAVALRQAKFRDFLEHGYYLPHGRSPWRQPSRGGGDRPLPQGPATRLATGARGHHTNRTPPYCAAIMPIACGVRGAERAAVAKSRRKIAS